MDVQHQAAPRKRDLGRVPGAESQRVSNDESDMATPIFQKKSVLEDSQFVYLAKLVHNFNNDGLLWLIYLYLYGL